MKLLQGRGVVFYTCILFIIASPVALVPLWNFPYLAGVYLLKVIKRNTRTSVFIVNLEYISHLVLVFLLLTLSR